MEGNIFRCAVSLFSRKTRGIVIDILYTLYSEGIGFYDLQKYIYIYSGSSGALSGGTDNVSKLVVKIFVLFSCLEYFDDDLYVERK